MGLEPEAAPPEPPPDTSAEDSQRSNAFAALMRAHEAQNPPEPEPDAAPTPDPEVERAVQQGAFGALSREMPPPEPVVAPPDPEVERNGLASSFGALAKTGRDLTPPPPPKPSPVPVGLQDQLPVAADMPDPQAERSKPVLSEQPGASTDDEGPKVNQWALAAALLTDPSGRAVQQVLGLAQQQRAEWEKSRGGKLTPIEQARLEIEKGNLDARNRELAYRNDVLKGKYGAPGGKAGPGAPPSPDDAVKPEPFNQDEVVTANLGDPPDPSQMGDRVPDFVDPGKPAGDKGLTPAQQLAKDKFEYQKQRDAKKDGDKSGKGDGGKLDLIPGTEPTDANASGYKSYIGASDSNRDKLTQIVAAHNEMRDGYAELEALRKELGPTWSDPANSAKFASIRGSIIGGAGKLRDLGVLQNAEYERLSNELPTLEVSGTEMKDRAKALFTPGQSVTDDPVIKRIHGMREAFESESDSKLKPYGIRLTRPDTSEGGGQGGGSAAPAKGSPESSNASPDSAGVEDDSVRYDVKLTSPKGKTITGSLSKAEVEGYASKGWKVQDASDSGPDIQPLKVGKMSKLAPSTPGELGPPVGLDVEVSKDDPIGKWTKRGRIAAPKEQEDPLKKYRDMGLLVE